MVQDAPPGTDKTRFSRHILLVIKTTRTLCSLLKIFLEYANRRGSPSLPGGPVRLAAHRAPNKDRPVPQ